MFKRIAIVLGIGLAIIYVPYFVGHIEPLYKILFGDIVAKSSTESFMLRWTTGLSPFWAGVILFYIWLAMRLLVRWVISGR